MFILKTIKPSANGANLQIYTLIYINSIHFQYTLLLGNFLFLYCNESVLFFLILNIQSRRFEFVKKFDTVRL
jgi:hypothetical protein